MNEDEYVTAVLEQVVNGFNKLTEQNKEAELVNDDKIVALETKAIELMTAKYLEKAKDVVKSKA